MSDSLQPLDCSSPGSSVHGIVQARILEWMPFLAPGDFPNPGIEPGSPVLQADSLLSEPPESISSLEKLPKINVSPGALVLN